MRFDNQGLIPAIVQHARSGEVLMLGYMNEEALRRTIEAGLVTFWSRSRQSIWQKGETSGNLLRVVELRQDCDGDTLLVLAEPAGPTCHTGQQSCFHRRLDGGVDRIGKKIGEEAAEVIIAAKNNSAPELTWELADLLFHSMLLLARQGVPIEAIWAELRRRHSA